MATLGLEGLRGLVLETILSKLEAKQAAAAVACVSTRLRAAVGDDGLWRHFCARDLDLTSPTDPDGNPCPSFQVAYKAWCRSFGMYPLPLVRRAKQFWSGMKNWMGANFQEAANTLRKGASESEIKWAEEALGVKFPTPTRVLYRFCDGQETIARDIDEHKRLAPLGIIGGYEFYDHVVNVHLLPLSQIVGQTRELVGHLGSHYAIVAASYHFEKWFFLNCSDGQLYVGTRNLADGEVMPCVPQSLVRPRPDPDNNVAQDGLLLWLEEHCRRLESGMIRTRDVRKSRTICLFTELPPSCSVAVTNGVQVRASAVFVPEMSDLSEEEDKYLFSYSIRMRLQPEGCLLDGTRYLSCQLQSRHWIIRSKDNVVSEVSAEAVIGKFPLLLPNDEEFVYQSCSPLPETPGSVEGYFTFVPGRLRKPEGRQFDARVAQFPLEIPDYIF